MGLRINRWLNRHPLLSVAILAVPVLLAASGGVMSSVWIWTQVVLALCLVIFVHELGHFLVAKWCGVQCDKFYIGFDVFGLKLFSKKWGETEYGIGLLPLGGYVKMLGQEDNPAKITEEIERAKAAGEEYEIDPRSYLAKSVPQRMAIISAGVIMNVIFAWVVASIAYGLGVDYTPGQIGGISSGGAAWQAGVNPGDTAILIDDVENPDFKDLRIAATFKDDDGVPFVVNRQEDGAAEPVRHQFQLQPIAAEGGRSVLGVEPNYDLVLPEENFVLAGTPAAAANPAFQAKDRFLAINGQELKSYQDWNRLLVVHQDETINFTVERTGDDGSPTTVEIRVPPRSYKTVGIVMTMGPIVAIREGSIAAERKIRTGDIIRSITPVAAAGEEAQDIAFDPMKLPGQTRVWAYQDRAVDIVLERDGKEMTVPNVPLTKPEWTERPLHDKSPVSLPALGIAYRVTNRIKRLEQGSIAETSARDKLGAGAQVVSVTISQPDAPEGELSGLASDEVECDLTEEYSWPHVMGFLLQVARPGSSVTLQVLPSGAADGTKPTAVTLNTEEDSKWTYANRGLSLEPTTKTQIAGSVFEAMELGLYETGEALTLIYRFLGRIPELWQGMGGPISIVRIAGSSAERGMAELLIFIAMLSANLAVINFLPIPVLDGGHFVFLSLEAIRGKPVSERVFLMFSYLGLLFLLAVMIFTVGLDISRLVS